MSTNHPVVQTERLTKRFGSTVAVNSLDMSVENGEIYGFLGPNGAGKTTTINMLLSLVSPTDGSAKLFGQPVGEDVHATHDRIGVLPAHTKLYDRLSARKHLEFVIRVKNADDDPESLLDRVGLDDSADRPAGDFSTGMAQRLKLAIALVGKPELLILDEPTSGLDPNGARDLRRIVQEENERGTTVFFSSHILEQVEALCDRVGIISEGRMIAEDSIADLRSSASTDAIVTVSIEGEVDTVVERLAELDAVSTIRTNGDTIDVVLPDPDKKHLVINAVSETESNLTDFAFEEVGLDELFAQYTDETMSTEEV